MRILVKFEKAVPVNINKKIPAIKAIRTLTKAGLRDSKECTEATRVIDTNVSYDKRPIDQYQESINIIRDAGGTVITDGDEWHLYEEEIKNILFKAKMSEHTMVEYEFSKLLEYVNYSKEIKKLK